jgi:MFS family permease
MSSTTIRESKAIRWIVLLVVSSVMAANYFFYDVLSPLQGKLREVLGFTNSEYGFLVSAYSIPNVFLAMAVIGGIILDKIGIRITGSVFVGFMAIGSLLTHYGSTDYFINGGIGYNFFNSFLKSYSPSLKMMTFGFFLFGLGAETSIVVFTKIIVKWFKGKEVALALGTNIAIARMGTALAFLFSASLANSTPWNKAIWIGAAALCLGLLAYAFYILFDLKLDKQIKQGAASIAEEEFRLSDLGKIVKIPALIYITLLCVTFYSAVFPFLKYAPDMMVNKFGFNPEKAGMIAAILPLGTIIFTPLFGLFTDYKGKSASVMILGSLLIILVHLTFVFTNINPYIPMFVLGIGFSLVPAAMWPSVAKIVDQNKLGTAYGLMFSIQNIGLWLFPLLIGIVLDVSNPGITQELVQSGKAVYNYTYPILMLSFLGILGIIFAVLLKREDKKAGIGLELPNVQSK